MSDSAPNAGPAVSRRLFLGIEIPAFVQAALAALQEDLPGARWQWPEDMHLTLRFLGNVTAQQQPRICQAMRGMDLAPFDLQVQGVGAFSDRVFWAAIKASGCLDLLKRTVDGRLAMVDIPLEDSHFVPHVTLARTPGSPQEAKDAFLDKHRALELAPWTVQYLTLFSSESRGSGPVYRVVERFALAAEHA